jgi:putative intracellular protease/amidase
MSAGKILVVFTSHTKLIGNDNPTGYYLPEAAHPYYILKAAGYELVAASPNGGLAPLDQASVRAFKEDADSVKFLNDPEAQSWVSNTVKLSTLVGKSSEFKAIFYPGGRGPVFDLPVDEDSKQLIRDFYEAGKPTSAVCHGPAVFTDVKLADGSYLVNGKDVGGFTNEEEKGHESEIPWLLETRLQERGARFHKAAPWQEKVVVDTTGGRTLICAQFFNLNRNLMQLTYLTLSLSWPKPCQCNGSCESDPQSVGPLKLVESD